LYLRDYNESIGGMTIGYQLLIQSIPKAMSLIALITIYLQTSIYIYIYIYSIALIYSYRVTQRRRQILEK